MLNALRALELHGRGWNVVPLLEASKKPVGGLPWGKFNTIRQSHDEVKQLFADHGGNVGVVCGEVSDNLFVLDCETDDVFNELWKATKHLPVLVVRTPRGGHIYGRCEFPVKPRTIDTKWGKVEIRSNGQYVVSYGSVHPNGMEYMLMTNPETIHKFPLGKLAGVEWLVLEYDPKNTELKKILRDSGIAENLAKGYTSRSEAEMALITLMVRKGYDKNAISSFLSSSGYGDKFVEMQDKSPSRAFAWLDLSIKKAQNLGHTQEFTEVQRNMSDLKTLLVSASLRGRKGATLYKALLVHINTCDASGKKVYHLSIREGCEKAGMSHPTFMKMNAELVQMGLVEIVKATKGIEGNSYSLNQKAVREFLESLNLQDFNTHINTHVTNCESFGVLGLFEVGSFGHSANQIYNILRTNPGLTIAQISKSTGRADNTVRRVLTKMAENGIVKREENGTWKTLDIDLKEYAVTSGSVGKFLKRRYRHIKERQNYRGGKGGEI